MTTLISQGVFAAVSITGLASSYTLNISTDPDVLSPVIHWTAGDKITNIATAGLEILPGNLCPMNISQKFSGSCELRVKPIRPQAEQTVSTKIAVSTSGGRVQKVAAIEYLDLSTPPTALNKIIIPESIILPSATFPQSVIKSVTIKNNGDGPASSMILSLVGSGFKFRSNLCQNKQLARFQSCTIVIQYDAENISSRTKNAQLKISIGSDEKISQVSADLINPSAPVVPPVSAPAQFQIALLLGSTPVVNPANKTEKFIIKNIGGSPGVPVIAMAGPNWSLRSLGNCSASIVVGGTCQGQILFQSNGLINGSYPGTLSVSSTSATITAEVTGSAINNLPPLFSVSHSSLYQSAYEEELIIDFSAIDPNNDQLVYSLTSTPALTGYTLTNGIFSFSPNHEQIRDYDIQVSVSDGVNPAIVAATKIRIFPGISLSTSSFTEGQFGNPLFSLVISGNKKITSISSPNLLDHMTLFRLEGSGTPTGSGNISGTGVFPVNPANNGSLTYLVMASVKYHAEVNIIFSVSFSDGTSYDYHKPLSIAAANLPYVRYDIWGTQFGATGKGYDYASIAAGIEDLNLTFSEWRTPIVARFKEAPFVCGGSTIENFDTSVAAQVACIRNQTSTDAETLFYFSRTFSGATEIGGSAMGTRGGAVVQKYPWSHTLVHELGHNLGLFHTFESFNNGTVIHCTGSGIGDCLAYPVYENTKSSSVSIVGDWSPTRFDKNLSPGYTSNFNYQGAVNDTPIDYFGGKNTQLYANSWAALINAPGGGYSSGNRVVIYGGSQSYSSTSGFVCLQQRHITNQYKHPVTCSLPSGSRILDGNILEEVVVKNVMSYWYRDEFTSVFTPGQKARMDAILNYFNELSSSN